MTTVQTLSLLLVLSIVALTAVTSFLVSIHFENLELRLIIELLRAPSKPKESENADLPTIQREE